MARRPRERMQAFPGRGRGTPSQRQVSPMTPDVAPKAAEQAPPARWVPFAGKSAAELRASLVGVAKRAWRLDTLYWLMAVATALWVAHVLTIGWNNTILDHHAFRQTQTAVSVLFLLRGGSWLAYETPFLGFPWAIPFEFPLYQWCVALLAKTGVGLDHSGRAVNAFFFLASLVPLWALLGHLRFRKTERLPLLLFFVLAPADLFWARTFMIESTALFAALCFLERTAAVLTQPGPLPTRLLVTWALSGAIAALVKATTFMPFAAAASLALAVGVLTAWRKRELPWAKRLALWGTVTLGAVFLILKAWTTYAEHLRNLNPLARTLLTVESLRPWIYGTWAQKTAWATWNIWFTERMIFYLGGTWVLPTLVLIPFLVARRIAGLALASLALWLLTFAVFTNLHAVHDYYQYANTVFLTSAAGLAMVGLMRLPRLSARVAAVLMTGAIAWSMATIYRDLVVPMQARDNRTMDEMAKLIDAHTTPDDVLYIVGWTWAPIAPYYCQRRAIMDHQSRPMTDPIIQEELGLLRDHGYRIGALISCGAESASPRTPERLSTLGVPILRGTVSGCNIYTRP